MISQWDRLKIDEQFSDCQTLKDALEKIEDDLKARGQVVCEIRVTGMNFSQDDESRFATSPMKDVFDIQISSQSPDRLVAETLISCLSLLPTLIDSSVNLADSFRNYQAKQVQKKFSELIDGCQWLFETVGYMQIVSGELAEYCKENLEWRSADGKIKSTLHDLVQAYKNHDYVLVGDLLEYEMSGALQNWDKLLRKFQPARE